MGGQNVRFAELIDEVTHIILREDLARTEYMYVLACMMRQSGDELRIKIEDTLWCDKLPDIYFTRVRDGDEFVYTLHEGKRPSTE